MEEIGALSSLFAKDLFDYCKPYPRYDNIVFFDCETTGLNAHKDDRIIELAAIQVTKTGLIRKEDMFVRLPPGRHIPAKIVELTGITDSMLRTGVSERECARVFSSMMTNNTLLVAHNAQFDCGFAGYMFIRHMAEHPAWLRSFVQADYLDTLTVFRDRKAKPHKLSDAITAYGLEGKVQNTHRAIDDVWALFEVTKAMAAERDDLITYVNIFGYPKKYGVSGKTLKKVRYQAQPYADGMKPLEATLPEVVRRIWPDRCGTA